MLHRGDGRARRELRKGGKARGGAGRKVGRGR